jgi:hypothetical protein
VNPPLSHTHTLSALVVRYLIRRNTPTPHPFGVRVGVEGHDPFVKNVVLQ